jgi:hypothetical protein
MTSLPDPATWKPIDEIRQELEAEERIYIERDEPGQLGHERYPLIVVPNCRTCRHPYRLFIENSILRGERAVDVIDHLPDDDKDAIAQSISNHFAQKHVPYYKTAVIEGMLRAAGITLEELHQTQSDQVTALSMVVGKFRHRLADPSFQPDMKEGLAAVKLMHDISTSSDGGINANDMFVALTTFLNHFRTILNRFAPKDAANAMGVLGRLLASDPILKVIADKAKIDDDVSPLAIEPEHPMIDVIDVDAPIEIARFDRDPDFDSRE